ncbi:hypothetical protein ZWY2020_025531 [Hordeum vulgare]|nr:hypothetical protein ZWY2020_025531 [Hordeum vulgare]
MAAAADRPPRDIRRGKRPVEDNSFKKCVPLTSAVCGSSPIAVQREDNPFKKCVRLISAVCGSSSIAVQHDFLTLRFSPFSSVSLQQPVYTSITSGPSFVSGFRTVSCAYPTPLVFPLPYVHPLQAGLNRRKRKFIWKHRSGKLKIKKLAPPFSKDHIDLLKDETPTSQSKKRQQNKDGLSPPDRKKSHVAKQLFTFESDQEKAEADQEKAQDMPSK